MTQISYPYTLTPGQPENISQVQADFDHIKTVVNGGLDNGNIAANAGIVGSKLRAARVGVDVAALGTAEEGAFGLLKLGSDPFEYLGLVYVAGEGWVSEAKWISASPDSGYFTNNSTSYNPIPCFQQIKDYKAIHDAGMRLQVCYSAMIFTDSGSHEARIGVNIYDFDNSDTAWGTLTTGFDAQNTTSVTAVIRARDSWAQPAITPTQKHGLVAIGLANQTVAHVTSALWCNLGYRFVSA